MKIESELCCFWSIAANFGVVNLLISSAHRATNSLISGKVKSLGKIVYFRTLTALTHGG